MKKRDVLFICVTAAGVALFVVLSLCLQVPVFENYYLCLGYVAMAVFCYSFGAAGGMAVGVLGVVLYCLLINGLRGMPGWALGNGLIGLVLGIVFGRTRGMEKKGLKYLTAAAAIFLSVTAGILGVKSLTESLLYTQPLLLRVGKNVYAWVADLVVLLISLPICEIMHPAIRKMFPDLVKE